MTTKRVFLRLLGIAVVPAVGWLLPTSLQGQVRVALNTPYATPVVSVQAILTTDPSQFLQAGILFDEAGRRLAVENPASVGLLVRAARLQYFGGDLTQARSAMKEAGWRALGQGQVQVAANAYADAALIALAQGDRLAATDDVAKVQVLAQWPGVSGAERRQIMKRIR